MAADRGGALITGGGARIGRAVALALARAGWGVALHGLAPNPVTEALADEIRQAGGCAATLAGDLADPACADRLVAEAGAALGPLDVLVNNASAFVDDRLGGLTAAGFDRHLHVNLVAPVLLAQAFAAQAPDGGAIVNLIDQRVLKPDPRFFSYAISKAALLHATRMMAQALAPRIRVVGVGPGPTLRSVHQSEAEFADEAAATPLGAAVDPCEIAEAVLFLLRSPSITGQMIAVDAGQHLAWRTADITGD